MRRVVVVSLDKMSRKLRLEEVRRRSFKKVKQVSGPGLSHYVITGTGYPWSIRSLSMESLFLIIIVKRDSEILNGV